MVSSTATFRAMRIFRGSSTTSPFAWPFMCLVCIGFFFPATHEHNIFSVKSLSFIASIISAGIYIGFRKRFYIYQCKIIVLVLCSLCFLILWSLIGAYYGHTPIESQLDQFKILLATVVGCAIGVYFYLEKLFTIQTLLKTIIYSNFVYSTLKLVALTLHIMGVVDLLNFLTSAEISLTSMGITDQLIRVQTSPDIFTPFILFFVLNRSFFGLKLSKKFIAIYTVISAMAIFISFARFLFGAAFLSLLLFWINLNWKQMLLGFVGGMVGLMLIFTAIGWDTVGTMVERRLFSTDNQESDQTRVDQIDALMKEYSDFQLMGKGVGGYAEDNIRAVSYLHSYEVQWAAFLMQFGLIGLLCFLTPLAVILFKYLYLPLTKLRVSCALLFLCWLSSGFTNPFLISLGSGLMYALFFIAALFIREQENTLKV